MLHSSLFLLLIRLDYSSPCFQYLFFLFSPSFSSNRALFFASSASLFLFTFLPVFVSILAPPPSRGYVFPLSLSPLSVLFTSITDSSTSSSFLRLYSQRRRLQYPSLPSHISLAPYHKDNSILCYSYNVCFSLINGRESACITAMNRNRHSSFPSYCVERDEARQTHNFECVKCTHLSLSVVLVVFVFPITQSCLFPPCVLYFSSSSSPLFPSPIYSQ